MASPTVVGTPTTTSVSTAATPYSVNLPGSIAAGDLLILAFRSPSGTTATLLTGWTRLVNQDVSDASDDSTNVWWRKADGTEAATISITPGSTTKVAALCWRITGAADPTTRPPEVSTISVYTTTANTADAPSLSPTGGSKDYLFLTVAAEDGELNTFTAPTGYINKVSIDTGTAGAVATNCAIAGAEKAATAASEDAGAWTHTAAATGGCAFTIAIHPAPYVPQPIDGNDVLVLHCDGADASTTFTDSSPSAKTVTAVGNAQVDTAQSKFGGASALFDGSGDYLTTPDHTDFEFGTGDFTIDFWMRLNSTASVTTVLTKRPNGGAGSFVFYQNTTSLDLYMSSDGATWNIASARNFATSIATGVWNHVALTRSGTTFRGFWNGVQSFTFTSSLAPVDNTQPVTVGADATGGGPYNGWVDEIRISKGVARWTTNFPVPDVPYAAGPATVIPDTAMALTVT